MRSTGDAVTLMVDPETVGFTDWDWGSDKGRGHRRRSRHVPLPAVGGMVTMAEYPPDDPAMGDLWFDSAKSRTMVWNGVDWLHVVTGGSPTGRLPPSFPRPDPTMPPGSMVLVVDGSLDDALAREEEIVRAYRARMEATAERWADKHGFDVARGSWSTLPPVDPMVMVPLRLECYLTPCTHGVWGEVWAARAEDAADLAAAAAVGGSMDPDPVQPPIVVHIEPEPL